MQKLNNYTRKKGQRYYLCQICGKRVSESKTFIHDLTHKELKLTEFLQNIPKESC